MSVKFIAKIVGNKKENPFNSDRARDVRDNSVIAFLYEFGHSVCAADVDNFSVPRVARTYCARSVRTNAFRGGISPPLEINALNDEAA